MLRRFLLGCGIASCALNVATDIIGALRYPGYSIVSYSASDLSALGAPTRSLVVPLDLVSDALMLAFGVGVWQMAGGKRSLRVSAGLMIGNAALSSVSSAFFPLHRGEAMSATPNLLNVVLGASGVTAFVLAMAFGAVAFRNWFRWYSIGTLVTYTLLAALSFVRHRPIPAGEPGSWVGIQERTMIAGYLLWIVLLAIELMREQAAVTAAHPAIAYKEMRHIPR